MKLTPRQKYWARAFVVFCAIMPMLLVFSSPGQWILGRNVWFVLLLAIGNGLVWLGLAVALAAVNRASTFGFTPVPVPNHKTKA